MKKEDLRVGNAIDYIIYNEGEREIVRCEIEASDFCAIDGNEDYQPIKLVDDIFIKFGFDKKNNPGFGFFWHKYGIPIIKMSDGNYCFNAESIENKYVYLDYVHELQNLFFVLTKKELSL